MSELHSSDASGRKRKKKRSQIQMAKKFARRRNHEGNLDQETNQYMVRVFELLREGFPSAEEKSIFVNNVYEETKNHEIEYARNQLGSRILESLLEYATLETVERLVSAFSSSFRPLSSDKFASHVLQKLIVVCADRGNRTTDKKCTTESEKSTDLIIQVRDSEVKSYNDIALKLSKYFINNMEEFVFDTYANHLLRTVIECLGGLIEKVDCDQKKKLIRSNPCERRSVVQEYKDLLVASCTRLHKWPRFMEFAYDQLTSGLLQSILHSLHGIDNNLVEIYVTKITQEMFKLEGNETVLNIFSDQSSARLLEACLAVASPESFSCIHKRFFSGHLKELSLSKDANFSVQRLLDYCTLTENFEPIIDELSEHVDDIFKQGHTGVLTSMANACQRIGAKQGPFTNLMMKLFHCDASNEKQLKLVACVVTLKNIEELENSAKSDTQSLPIQLHGSLIIQAMLRFKKPIKIVTSILDMDADKLFHIFGDPKGSRIVDAFMESAYIGEKSREKLAKKLQGSWAQLALSKHGSRCLDRIWEWAQMKQKVHIMEELGEAGESLRSTTSGKIVSSKLNVSLFIKDRKTWTESIGKEQKTRALFANIIGDLKNVRK